MLLDFRHVTNDQTRSFLTLWAIKSFLSYIRYRGPGKQFGLMIDELKALFLDPHSAAGDSAVSTEVIQLLEVYARNYNVWPTLITQDPLSFGPKVQQSLLGIGTQIVGLIRNTEAATLLSSALLPLSTSTTTSLDQQKYAGGQKFKNLAPFHFLVRPTTPKGVSQELIEISIERYVEPWPDETTDETRRTLNERNGIPTEDLLSVITSRLARLTIPDARPQRDTLKHYDTPDLPAKSKEPDDIY